MLRKAKGLTLEQAAAEYGVHFNSISKWENGKSEPSSELLIQLSKYYGIPLNLLLGVNEVNSFDDSQLFFMFQSYKQLNSEDKKKFIKIMLRVLDVLLETKTSK